MQMFASVMGVIIEAGKRLGHAKEIGGSRGGGGSYFS